MNLSFQKYGSEVKKEEKNHLGSIEDMNKEEEEPKSGRGR